MKNEILQHLFIIFLLVISGSACSQEAVMLKYKFVQGKTYIQTSSVSQNTVQTFQGQEMKNGSDMKSISEYKVENVDNDGNATLLVSFREMSFHFNFPGKDTSIVHSGIRYTNRVVFSSSGKSLSSVKVDTTDISLTGDQTDFNKLFKTLPGKMVTAGEKWEEKTTENRKASQFNPFASDVTTVVENTFTGKEIKDNGEFAKISFKGTMTITGKINQMGMEMGMEGEGKTEGFCYFDTVLSMVVYTEELTEMNMNISVSGQQTLTIPVTLSMKSVTTFEEEN
jgi:hypothetical protein